MNIVIIAGEASGDNLGGKLVSELKNLDKEIALSGIGGHNMRAAGMHTLVDISETSVVGIVEILRHYPRLRSILSRLKKHIATSKPDLLILIDYPEFNLKLAAYAKKIGIKVLFYVSPQLWAWRTERVKKIKHCVNLMAVLFPFEVDFYQQHDIPVCLVQHPMVDDTRIETNTDTDKKPFKTLGILPGSRKSEIKRLLPVMIEAAGILKKKHSDLAFIIPVAPNIDSKEIQATAASSLKLHYSHDDFYSVLQECDVLVAASGTATLQAALLGKAMVIIYKISPLTHWLFSHLIKVKHIGLPNIILGRREFTELIQYEANAAQLSQELDKLLCDQGLSKRMIKVKKELQQKLATGINSHQLALKAIQLAKS
jgi:lipid-A-disaccharide synthase